MTEETKIDEGDSIHPANKREWVEYPPEIANIEGTKGKVIEVHHPGISRRNELADKIIAGLCANPAVLDSPFWMDLVDGEDPWSTGVDFAYRQADAMIARGRET